MEYVFADQCGVLTVREKDSIGKPQNIRFIDSSYRTLFEIPDGAKTALGTPPARCFVPTLPD